MYTYLRLAFLSLSFLVPFFCFGIPRGSRPPSIIALFVILVVAMVILKMFTSQIEDKKAQLEEESRKQKLAQTKDDIESFCKSKCNT